MRIYFPLVPISFYEALTLVYDYNYTSPIKHFHFDSQLTHIIKNIIKGICPEIPLTLGTRIQSLDFIGFMDIELPNLSLDYFIIDGSIGGPSVWGRQLHNFLEKSQKLSAFLSYSRMELDIQGEKISIAHIPHKKIIYTTIARYLVLNLLPDRCIIIGRDWAARMFDIVSPKKTMIVETGYGDENLFPFPLFSHKIEELLINEILFRENTYPWDSFTHRYAASRCVEKCQNIFWSEKIAKKIHRKFPDSEIFFSPPNVLFKKNVKCKKSFEKQMTILAGLGHHQSGQNSINFLNLMPLLKCTKRLKDKLRVILLSKNPELLRKQTCDYAVEILPFFAQEEFFKLFSYVHVYYRVQNDASIPISVIEAMSQGCVPIVNKKCASTWSDLINGKNTMFVEYGNQSDLNKKLQKLLDDPENTVTIGNNAKELVLTHCDLKKNLESVGII